MKFGKVVEQSIWFFNFVPSDPPIYSTDRRMIQSKDGMSWAPVAPHAAAAGCPVTYTVHTTNFTGFANVAQGGVFGGAAPAPGPYVTVIAGGSPQKS